MHLDRKWIHTIVGTIATLAVLITTDQQVRSDVISFFEHHPKVGTDILAIAGIIAAYVHTSNKGENKQ